MKKQLLLALSAMLLVGPAFAADGNLATFNIRLEENPAQSDVLPVYSAPVTKDHVAFKIVNNTGKAIYLVNGNDRNYIPVVSNNTVEVPYQSAQYKVVDEAGNTVATWQLQAGAQQAATVQSASAAQYSDWEQRIQTVLENSRNRSWTAYTQQQSQSTSRAVTPQENTTVRGFW